MMFCEGCMQEKQWAFNLCKCGRVVCNECWRFTVDLEFMCIFCYIDYMVGTEHYTGINSIDCPRQ